MLNLEQRGPMLALTKCPLAVLTCLAIAGCTRANPNYDSNPALPDQCRIGEERTEAFTEFARPEKLDILFVVDSSNDDPAALQEIIANAVAPVGIALEELELDDVRFAVATTAADGGLAEPGLTGPDCGRNEEVVVEYGKGDWAKALRCNLFAVPSSDRFDQPLAVVDNLLDDPPEGFLRDDSRVLVVIATRSDDCSHDGELSGDPREACASAELRAPDELVEGWLSAMPSRDSLGLVVFAGPPSAVAADDARPVCSSTVGSAFAGNRLFEATEIVGEFGIFHSVCTDDVVPPLTDTLDTFVASGTTTVCPSAPLAHEPLSVLADGDAVPLGVDGFTYLSATPSCSTGAIRFATRSLRDVDEVEITYCTE